MPALPISERVAMPDPTTTPSSRATTSSRSGVSSALISAIDWVRS